MVRLPAATSPTSWAAAPNRMPTTHGFGRAPQDDFRSTSRPHRLTVTFLWLRVWASSLDGTERVCHSLRRGIAGFLVCTVYGEAKLSSRFCSYTESSVVLTAVATLPPKSIGNDSAVSRGEASAMTRRVSAAEPPPQAETARAAMRVIAAATSTSVVLAFQPMPPFCRGVAPLFAIVNSTRRLEGTAAPGAETHWPGRRRNADKRHRRASAKRSLPPHIAPRYRTRP